MQKIGYYLVTGSKQGRDYVDGYRLCGCDGGGCGCDDYPDWRMVMAGFDRSVLMVTGAYGRESCYVDWTMGKDFKIMSGPYFSNRDIAAIKAEGVEQIVFYNHQGHVAFVENL